MTIRKNISRKRYLLYCFALWFPLLFATPIFILFNNIDDLYLSPLLLSSVLLVICAIATLSTTGILILLRKKAGGIMAYFILALAVAFVVQGNIVHDFYSYSQFNGEEIDWKLFGDAFWLDLCIFVSTFIVCLLVFFRLKKPPRILPWLLIASSIVVAIPAVLNNENQYLDKDAEVDMSVFSFSPDLNVVHLIPDGMQSDIAQEVLEANPDLLASFKGFTLFEDHSGQYRGTAPSIPTLFNGEAIGLDKPFSFKRAKTAISEKSYQKILADQGYRLDYVTINSAYCLDGAASCTLRPFNYFKSRGYFSPVDDPLSMSLGLIADLTLFRHLPLILKERIYRGGDWLFGATTRGSFYSQYPDQVIREWDEYMDVSADEPVYKLYHYIGTHVPPRWDAKCNYKEGLTAKRETIRDQTFCVLTTIAEFLRALDEHGIYDKTLIVITGDHGSSIKAKDVSGNARNASISPHFIGHARPVFMLKGLMDSSPLGFSDLPTSVIDVAPTIMGILGERADFEGHAALSEPAKIRSRGLRSYYHYKTRLLFHGKPVPYEEYTIAGSARDAGNWFYSGLHNVGIAPPSYPRISSATIKNYSLGLISKQNKIDTEGLWIEGREFAFLISLSEPDNSRLLLELQIPEEILHQTIRISINGGDFTASTQLSCDDDWMEVAFSLKNEHLYPENNFVRVQFQEQIYGNRRRPASALLRSIHLDGEAVLKTIECLSPP